MATVLPARKTPAAPPLADLGEPEKPARKSPAKKSGLPETGGTAGNLPAHFVLGPNEDFWDWISGFSTEEWQHLIAYLWRVSPTTDRRMAGKPTSIRKYASRFDLERVMLDEGSGSYRIDFCWIDPTGKKQARLAQHYFQILNMEYPPKVPYGEWINEPENETWKWAERALKEKSNIDPSEGKNGSYDPSAFFNTVLRGVEVLRGPKDDNTTFASQLVTLMMQNQDRMLEMSDPAKQLQTVRMLMGEMSPREDSGIKLVVEILRDQLRATQEELRELRNNSGKAPSLATQIAEAKELATALGFKVAGSNGAAGTDWGPIIASTFDKLLDQAPLIWDALKNRADNNAAVVAAGGNARAGFQFTPAAAPGQAPTPTPSSNPAAAPQPAEPLADTPEREAFLKRIVDEYGSLIQSVVPFMIDKFRAESGYDFRDWFIDRRGLDNWILLRDNVGIDTLIELVGKHQVLKVALSPPEKLRDFLEQCFTPQGEEPEGHRRIDEQSSEQAEAAV